MYQRFDDLLERPNRPLRVVAYVPQGDERRPDGTYLVATTAHSEADSLPCRMQDYAMQEGLELRGPAYTTYLPANGAGERLLQIAVGVRRKEE
jgi:isopenicillin N synthase-like dioxygenase